MNRIDRINMLDWLKEDYKIEPRRLKQLYIECNTLDMELETDLYRIISYERLKEILKNQSLTMSKPKTWEDPYETFLMNYKARLEDGAIVGFDLLRDRIYYQCWSLRKECEGLWKAHTRDAKIKDRYVKIKANANKLMEYFYETNNTFHLLTYFIGMVSYFEEEFFNEILNDGIGKFFSSMSGNMPMIYSLLMKRKAFDYEDEVRLILNVPDSPDTDFSTVKNKWDTTSDYFTYQIDINDVIEEVIFDPYLEEGEFNELKKEIMALGYKGEINYSNLYTKR